MKKIFVIIILTLLVSPVFSATKIDPNISDICTEEKEPILQDNEHRLTWFGRTYMVEMRDGVKLATDVYLPIAQNKPHGSIFLRTPYNKDDLYELGVGIALLGWPVIIQDIRGMHASEGVYEGYRKCQVDGPDSLAWIASRDWSNGIVSTFASW